MGIQVSLFIGMSLDGYIAGENGDLGFLDDVSRDIPKDEDLGYYSFLDSVDVLVWGRKTFEKVLSFGGDWPYGEKPVIVLSSGTPDIPEKISNTVSHSSEKPAELCNRLKKQGVKRIYLDGGITIQRFLNERLVTDMTINLVPVILGKGIPLFSQFEKPVFLKHKDTAVYEFGHVQTWYDVIYDLE